MGALGACSGLTDSATTWLAIVLVAAYLKLRIAAQARVLSTGGQRRRTRDDEILPRNAISVPPCSSGSTLGFCRLAHTHCSITMFPRGRGLQSEQAESANRARHGPRGRSPRDCIKRRDRRLGDSCPRVITSMDYESRPTEPSPALCRCPISARRPIFASKAEELRPTIAIRTRSSIMCP